MSSLFNRKTQLNESIIDALKPSDRPRYTHPSGEMAGRRRDMNSFELDLDRIVPDADQVRKSNKSGDDPGIIEMSESMKDHGVLQPLTVRYDREGDYYKLIAGERRYQAAKLARLTSVPVKLHDVDEKTAELLSLVPVYNR